MARPGVTHNRDGHDADGASAGDEHVFAEDREGQRGVDSVAKGIEDGGDARIDAGVMAPDVGHGQRDVLGESTGTIDADPLGVGAQVTAARHAVATATADNVALAADQIAGMEVVDVRADSHDFADKFVADSHWYGDGLLRPLVPLINVHIGATDASVVDAYEYVVDADPWLGDVLEPEAFDCFAFDKRFHEKAPDSLSAEKQVTLYCKRF